MTREEITENIKAMCDEAIESDGTLLYIKAETAETILMAIEALTAEAVEVVRCKDCKWYKKIAEKSKSGLCHYDLVARCLHDDDYCSHGERREE